MPHQSVMSKECDKHFLFQDLCDCPPNMLQIIEKIKAFAEVCRPAAYSKSDTLIFGLTLSQTSEGM